MSTIRLHHNDDEGHLVGAAPVDETGRITDSANMERQMRLAFPQQLVEISFTAVVNR